MIFLAPIPFRGIFAAVSNKLLRSAGVPVIQKHRQLSRQLQPQPEDLTPELSTEAITEYNDIKTKFDTLSTRSIEGGGAKGIERHVIKNKKVLVRDRIKMLVDPGTQFLELGQLAGYNMDYGDVPAAGIVTGIGRVAGVYCMIGGNDATIKGGTYYPITVKKSLRSQEIAERNRLPCIYMPDSGGAFLPLQSEIFLPGGRGFFNQAVMSSQGIPQIAVVCGSCTAGGAYNPTMSDEAIIIDRIGKIFLGGPPLVRAALGEVVSEEDLGGAFMHSSVSGCTDYYAKEESEAFEMCRDVVESMNMNPIPGTPTFQEPDFKLSSWDNFGAKEHLTKCELYAVLSGILDGSKFKEFKAFYGPGLLVGTGNVEGMPVGIISNSDEILSAEALKAAHFLDLCNRRGIPVLFLQNSLPITAKSSDIMDQLVLKDRGKMSSMVATLDVPKIALTLSACHEDDFLLMCGPAFNPNLHFMWPNAKISMVDMMEHSPAEYDDIGPLDAFSAAANCVTDGIISPSKTREVVAETLRILSQQKLNTYQHRPMPVFRM